MTPELPFAPMSAASAAARATLAAVPPAHVAGSAGRGAHRHRHVGAGIAVGHGEDVDRVDGVGLLGERGGAGDERSRQRRPVDRRVPRRAAVSGGCRGSGMAIGGGLPLLRCAGYIDVARF